MKIIIDSGLCAGHGRCFDLAPGLFVDDDDGFGQVRGDGTVAPEHEEAARRAVRACPERAITLSGLTL
jgi:ferredoxin